MAAPVSFRHPLSGLRTTIDEPICGDTKKELVDKILGLLEAASQRLAELRAEARK